MAGGRMLDVRERHARFYREQTVRRWRRGTVRTSELGSIGPTPSSPTCARRSGGPTSAGDLADGDDDRGALGDHGLAPPALRAGQLGARDPRPVVEADLPQLPRLYVAASLCLYLGQPDLGVTYAQTATALGGRRRRTTRSRTVGARCSSRWHICSVVGSSGGSRSRRISAATERFRSGRRALRAHVGAARGGAGGRGDEPSPTRRSTRPALYGSPFWIGWALGGYGRAFADARPVQALDALREGLAYARENRLGFWEANLAQDAARLEASHGELDDALGLCSPRRSTRSTGPATSCSSRPRWRRWRSSSTASDEPRWPPPSTAPAPGRPASDSSRPSADVIVHLRSVLGHARFDELVAVGAAQETAEAVRFAQLEIERIVRDVAA